MNGRYTLAGRWYAPSAGRLCDSLFITGGTAHGIYKRRKGGIALHAPDGRLRAFIVVNDYGERFAVSAHNYGGRPRYLHALCDDDREWLGLPDGLQAEREAIAASLAELEAT